MDDIVELPVLADWQQCVLLAFFARDCAETADVIKQQQGCLRNFLNESRLAVAYGPRIALIRGW